MSTDRYEDMEQSQKDKHLESGPHSNGYDETLNKLRSVQSISMSPEMFEKLYLSPPNKVSGDLRRTFGNPTPLALVGFLLSLMPLSCSLMGWRGAGDFGIASIAVYFFMGGLLMFFSGILEWIIGNSFPATVFCSFGAFFFAFGGTLNPNFGAYSFYATSGGPDKTGLGDPKFNASFGFWLLAMGLLVTLYMICALRTNVVFVLIFLTLIPVFGLLTAAFWYTAEDVVANAAKISNLFVAAGAVLFVTGALGWYMLAAIMLALVDFPVQLPVGDLSHIIKGKTARSA